MATVRTTRDILQAHGLPYHALTNLISSGKFKPPAKTSGGIFVWTEADERAFLAALASVRARRKAVPK